MYVFTAAVLLVCGSIFVYDVIGVDEVLEDDNQDGNSPVHRSDRQAPDFIPRETDVGDPSDVITHVKPKEKMIVASQKPQKSSGQKPEGKSRVVRDRPAADDVNNQEVEEEIRQFLDKI